MKYEQKSQHSTWEIIHEFDHNPKVKCWVDVSGDLIRIIPKDINFNEGMVIITLSRPYIGEAILSSSKAWDKE